ncbi:MAG: Glu/Leu/Phe/Val dehydrogenase dimerization domain-containing protein, partial [Dehalococcoidia bacterium]
MQANGHEELAVWTDTAVGLKAFIAIHDTTLGPALGGTRIWPHATDEEAIMDV